MTQRLKLSHRARNIHVTDLAARTGFLAVEVDLCARFSRKRQRVDTENVFVLAAQIVLHHGNTLQHGSVTQRQIQHSTQVLLELAGHRAVLSPVAGVVRAHRQLIDVEACGGAGNLEKLGSHYTGHAQLGGNGHRSGCGSLSDLGVQVLCGCNDLVTDGVHLNGLNDRPGAHLAAFTASNQSGELTGEGYFLLGKQSGEISAGRQLLEPFGAALASLFGGIQNEYALAVVAAARGLQHHGPADFIAEGEQLVQGRNLSPAGVRQPQTLNSGAHQELVLSVLESFGTGLNIHTLRHEGAQKFSGHMLMVESDDILAASKFAEGVQIFVVPDGGGTYRCHGADGGRLCENLQVEAKVSCCGCHHAGQLASADDANYGSSHRVSHST